MSPIIYRYIKDNEITIIIVQNCTGQRGIVIRQFTKIAKKSQRKLIEMKINEDLIVLALYSFLAASCLRKALLRRNGDVKLTEIRRVPTLGLVQVNGRVRVGKTHTHTH